MAKAKKLALPSAAELGEAMKLVDEVYKGDISLARTQGQKENLARKMRADASGEKNLTARYAVWVRSRDLAVEAGDVGTVEGLIEEMDRTFEMDAVKVAGDCAGKLLNMTHTPGQRRGMVSLAKVYAEKALREENYEAAKLLAEKGLSAARMLGEAQAVKDAAGVKEEVAEAEAACVAAKKGLAVLAEKPDDAEANLRVGDYWCFYRGNWKQGLVKLSKGSDKGLAELAKVDAAVGADVDERMKVADGWWEAGLRFGGTMRRAMEDRACRYYSELLPALGGGLSKLKAERRIAEAEWVPEAGAIPAAPPFVMQMLGRMPKELFPAKEDGPRELMEKNRKISEWVSANPVVGTDGAWVSYLAKLGSVDVAGRGKPALNVQWEQGFEFNGVAVKVVMAKHRDAPLGKEDPEYAELMGLKKDRPEGVYVVTGKATGLTVGLRRGKDGGTWVEVKLVGDGVVGRVAE